MNKEPKKQIDLATIPEEDLLALRVNDLPLSVEGTWLEECIAQLYKELEDKGIVFKPVCYLADEWLTPENEPVVGIPFYLAHPTLVKLEKKIMLEAEGSTKEWCMQLLRHEAGHAISYAYLLQKKKKWKDVFSYSSQEYSDTCRFRPYSKNYVRHLDGFYAQVHPEEDFVETFAVWLTPDSDWQNKYSGWKALKKLCYVDDLMRSIKDKPPVVKQGRKDWHFKQLRITLQNFYKKRKKILVEEFPDFHDDNLKKIFAEKSAEIQNCAPAKDIVKKHHKAIVNDVSLWSGEKKYIINGLLKAISKRCRELKLVVQDEEPIVLLRISIYLTTLVMNYLYTGRYRGDKGKRVK